MSLRDGVGQDTNDTASLLGTASPCVLQNNTTYWFFLTDDGDIVARPNEQVGDLRACLVKVRVKLADVLGYAEDLSQ